MIHLETFDTLRRSIKGQVLKNKEILNFYSVDASLYQIIPDVVVIPETEKDVITTVKFANRKKIPLTVRGAGTGLVGGSLNTGIIVDLKNLCQIKISKKFAIVQPGVLKGNLDIFLEKNGKFFPPNPSIGSYCAIGGIIGNNASGSRTLKYGSTIDNILEITFIDGKGEKIILPKEERVGNKILKLAQKINLERYPKTSKNSCGYRLDSIKSIKDTHKILAGSEGTLGIMVSAKIRIRDIPLTKYLFIVEYNSLQKAANDCLFIKKTNPSAIEFVDKSTLLNFNFKFKRNTNCILFVEYDSNLGSCEKELKKIIGPLRIKKIRLEKEIQKWWKYRDLALSYSLKSIRMEERVPHIIEDAAVPIEKLEKLFELINKINKKFHTKTVMYGHAGNGNIHVRLISSQKNKEKLQKISKEYFEHVIKLGGTITAEHGDGIARSPFVKKQYGDQNYKTFKELKKALDPNWILNPGKIISDKTLKL